MLISDDTSSVRYLTSYANALSTQRSECFIHIAENGGLSGQKKIKSWIKRKKKYMRDTTKNLSRFNTRYKRKNIYNSFIATSGRSIVNNFFSHNITNHWRLSGLSNIGNKDTKWFKRSLWQPLIILRLLLSVKYIYIFIIIT